MLTWPWKMLRSCSTTMLRNCGVTASSPSGANAFVVGATLIELLAPTRPDSPTAAFLDKRGTGLHPTEYRVADLDAEMARLRGEGARFLSEAPTPGRAGTRVAFLHPKWGAGTLIELVEHPAGGPAH